MENYSIHAILCDGEKKFKGHPYIFERKGDAFEGKPYDTFASDVRHMAAALLGMKLSGRNIILYGENSYHYMAADIAIMGYVGVSCTLSKEWGLRDLSNAVELLDAGAVVYSNAKTDVIAELRHRNPQLRCMTFDELANFDAQMPLAPRDPHACSKIIFSSGTTGIPKAVMLSTDNMYANWESLRLRTPFTPQDRDYLFLPLSHTYGGICNFLYSLTCGMQIYLCSDTTKIMEELQMVRPTVFCAVPLIFERVYAACIQGNIPPAAALGGSIRYLFSGGAYLKPEIRAFLKGAGLNLLEAYGLTETSSLISCEYTDAQEFESVGTVMENMDIRIDSPDENGVGEILVRGGNVFGGYYRNESATAAAFDEEGFFRTGDLGHLVGRKLYLMGRKRRMILRSNGENVYPDEIETLLAEFPQIHRAKVYEQDGVIKAALYTEYGFDAADAVEKINENLPKFAKIDAFECITDSVDTRLK